MAWDPLVFCSCSVYALGCYVGPRRAIELVTAAVGGTEKDPVLATGCLRELRDLARIALRVDGGATHLSKSRSRSFASALGSDSDVWFSIDDDVSVSKAALQVMLAAVEGPEPRIVLGPYTSRGGDLVVVEWSPIFASRVVHTGGKAGVVRRCVRGGFGAVMLNRQAMQAVADAAPKWRDDSDGELKPGPFLEYLDGERWVGEDLAFFERLPSSVSVEACCTGDIQHGDHRLLLDSLLSEK